MGERKQLNRWRCLTTGCNPVLDETLAEEHKKSTGHRVAKWPVRSAKGQKKAAKRNRSGYYDKYNVGEKSYVSRVDNGYMSDIHGLLGNDTVSMESGWEGHGQW